MTDADYREEVFATTADHVDEYTRNHGAARPQAAWVLSPFDTWEANPSFMGPRPPHPESDPEEIDAWYDANPVIAPPKTNEEIWDELCDKNERPTPFF